MPFCLTKSQFMWLWNFIIPFTRFWGILTAIVLCGVGIDVVMHYHLKGIYILVASFIVFILEISWIFSYFRRIYVFRDNRTVSFWHVPSIRQWQKSLLYLPLSIAIVFDSYRVWLSYVASAMLVVLACLHILMSFRNDKKKVGKRILLLNEEDYQERHEEVIFEILDNSIRVKDETAVEEPVLHTLDI